MLIGGACNHDHRVPYVISIAKYSKLYAQGEQLKSLSIMENTSEMTLDEKMILTLDLVRKALYENGLCGKLFTYLKHAETLLTENSKTDNRKAYDLLDLFRDFMNRYKSRRLKKSEEYYFMQELTGYKNN